MSLIAMVYLVEVVNAEIGAVNSMEFSVAPLLQFFRESVCRV
jgi:hypothetical protein